MPPVATDADLAALRQARRILVLGSPGAGKTFLSAALSRHLGLELLHLDDFFWKPGRVRLPTDEWRQLVVQLVQRPAWVMDGTYEASLDLRLPAAQAIVYIRSSRWICLWRVVTRRLLSGWRSAGESARGHALTAFFVGYVFRFPATTQTEVLRLLGQQGQGKPLIVLEGSRAVDRLVRRLAQGHPGASSPADGVAAHGGRADRRDENHA